MKLKNLDNIWRTEFRTMEELYENIPCLKMEDPEAEVLGITQFEYSGNNGTVYFLWLASKQKD